jgi:regulatory helix-turn-helix LysR family protein
VLLLHSLLNGIQEWIVVTWAMWPHPSLLPVSFRAAASQLGVTSSGLSHLMRQLEERLAVQLLTSGQVVVDNLAEA